MNRRRFLDWFRDEVSRWTHGEDWRTWVAHAVICLLLVPVFGPEIAVGYYFLRECEQMFYRFVNRQPFKPFDHIMDVLVPTLAVVALLLIVHWLGSL